VLIDTIRNIFDFGQGLTPPVGPQLFLMKKLPSFTFVLQKTVDLRLFKYEQSGWVKPNKILLFDA
jgi:hypothetical protein